MPLSDKSLKIIENVLSLRDEQLGEFLNKLAVDDPEAFGYLDIIFEKAAREGLFD